MSALRTLLDGTWGDVYLIYAVASLDACFSCLLVRIAYGVSVSYLIRTRCYELAPVRFLFHSLHVGSWLASCCALCIAVRQGWIYYETSSHAHGQVALIAASVCLSGAVIGRAVFVGLIRIADNRPPNVAVRGVEKSEGIEPSRLAHLGREQFPQMLAYGQVGGIWVRGVLAVGGAAFAAWMIAGVTDWGRQNGWYDGSVATVRFGRDILPPVPRLCAIPGGLSAGLGLLMLLWSNQNYTFLRFSTTLLGAGGLSAVCWCSAAVLGMQEEHLAWVAGGMTLAFVVRWGHDLQRAFHFTSGHNVTQPIASRLSVVASPLLATLKSRSDCRLTKLDDAELCKRITAGCRNLEDSSVLVTRNVARFLSLARIEFEHFAAAMLRYLTVRRYVTTIGGGGTNRMLQHPVVPQWNESLFPLLPPSGFRDWLDPLRLDREWDIVATCSRCNGDGRVSCFGCHGSGRQQRTETYTEYSGGQSATRTRSYTVSCSNCGGSGHGTCADCAGFGRLVYHQTLNTQWRRAFPTCTTPHVHVPEFMDDAEERTYYRVPLIDDRRQVARLPEHDGIGPDLATRLSRVVPTLAAELPKFSRAVEQWHDGIVYRADFQVTGFWVLRIAFRRLPGKVGWFFGRRPEFHFPTLPLAWGTVATVLFVLPFILLSAWLAIMAVAARLPT